MSNLSVSDKVAAIVDGRDQVRISDILDGYLSNYRLSISRTQTVQLLTRQGFKKAGKDMYVRGG
jgi:hypothetical protein